MAGDAVLDRQHGHRGLGILHKQGVVADAQAQHQVKLGLLFVEQQRLPDGVAHRLGFAVSAHRLSVGDAQKILGNRAVFADDRDDLKTVIFQNLHHFLRLLEQAGAEGQADLFVAGAVQEFDDLDHAGILAVTARFGQGGTVGDPVVFRVPVQLFGLLLNCRVLAGAFRQGLGHILFCASALETLCAIVHNTSPFNDALK